MSAVDRLPGRHYSVHNDTMQGLADAVRNLRGEDDAMTPIEMIKKINASWLGSGQEIDFATHINPETGLWERPADWPDLDAIEIPVDFDGEYLTYDLSKTPGYAWIGIRCQHASSATMTVARGHLENNVFVVDESFTVTGSSVNFRRDLDPEDGNIQIWRVTSSKPIQRIYFCSSTGSNTTSIAQKLQPCVEAAGQLLYVTGVASDAMDYRNNYYSHATIWMEHDSRAVKSSAVTTLKMAWYQAYNLQSLDLSKWDIGGSRVTSLESTFSFCYSLHDLDLSDWDTSNWAVTTMASCWNGCYSLKSINISSWDTSNWAVTSLASCWYLCRQLKKLDISGWDVSNWRVTTLASAWYECRSIVHLPIGCWNVSNWRVTTLASAWRMCIALVDLPIGDWDTSNWALTSLSTALRDCRNLKSLDLSGWDTSNWAVTTLQEAFYNCCSLKSLNISSWDTSNWAVTTLAGTFEYCMSLKSVNIKRWDVSNWRVTSLQYMYGYCYSMESVDLTGWDTSNWTLSAAGFRYMFTDCLNMRSLKGLEDWDCLAAATNYTLPSSPVFEEFTGVPLTIGFDISANNALTVESLVRVFQALPTVSVAKTLKIGYNNLHKITDEQKAIATSKGWTVTN